MDQQKQSRLLVEKAQEGDRRAFDHLTQRYTPRLVALIEARLGNYLRSRVDIDDLLQEVLLRSFASLPRFRWSQDEAFFRWLSVIARNVIHEAARREKRELLLPCEEDLEAKEPSPGRALQRCDRFKRVRAAIDHLKPEYRDVILLARIERLPLAKVAERMGRTPNAVGLLLRRALKKLKEEFGDTDSLHLPDRSLLDEEDASDD